jgi:hypothetical protein
MENLARFAASQNSLRSSDPMPDDILELLRVIGGFDGEPTQNTLAAGGPFLYRVYTEHQHLLANRQE